MNKLYYYLNNNYKNLSHDYRSTNILPTSRQKNN